jgi:hypothetical protein
MPMKGSGAGQEPAVTRWEGGLSWIAHPDEGMLRASHALATDDGVWLVDPVDAEGLDDLLADLGEVVGVAVCLDRHHRDAATLAARHEVSVWVPRWMRGSVDFESPEYFDDALPGTDYRVIPVVDNPFWKEAALFDADAGTLVVPEAVGTGTYFRGGDERLGVHPMLRAFPPRRQLGDLAPERVLVGHGEPVTTGGTEALREALRGARRRAPAAFAGMVGNLFGN